jgi:hypothetical protein
VLGAALWSIGWSLPVLGAAQGIPSEISMPSGSPEDPADQPETPTSQPETPTSQPETPGSQSVAGRIPSLTVIELEIDQPLGSKISKSGQMFALHLRKAIVVDGKELVPAGTTGQGEVVHAKKGGGSGAPGELVLAARYLDVGGRRLPLRSFHVSGVGSDKITAVNTLAVASAVSPVPVALLGFFMTGGETNFAKGVVAGAKTAAEFTIDPAAPPSTPPTPMPTPTPTPKLSPDISGGDLK